MGQLRFFRRVQLAPGLRMNLSKRGASLSFGVRGAHLTVGRSGVRRTVGLPGTGIFYTSQRGWHTGVHSARHFTPLPPASGPQHSNHGCLMIALIVLGLVILTILGQVFGR